MEHQRLADILPVNKAVRANTPKQKTIISQTFAQFAATFSAVEIDSFGQGAYSSRLSLLRQPPLSRGLIFCSLKKQITDKCECLMVSHCDKNRQEGLMMI